MRSLRRQVTESLGQTVPEYALIIAGLSIPMILLLNGFGTGIVAKGLELADGVFK